MQPCLRRQDKMSQLIGVCGFRQASFFLVAFCLHQRALRGKMLLARAIVSVSRVHLPTVHGYLASPLNPSVQFLVARRQ